jgi:hypothetical protein
MSRAGVGATYKSIAAMAGRFVHHILGDASLANIDAAVDPAVAGWPGRYVCCFSRRGCCAVLFPAGAAGARAAGSNPGWSTRKGISCTVSTIGALRQFACVEVQRCGLPVWLRRLVLAKEERGLEGDARRLFGSSRARSRNAIDFPRQPDFDLVDAENGGRACGMPSGRKRCGESVVNNFI